MKHVVGIKFYFMLVNVLHDAPPITSKFTCLFHLFSCSFGLCCPPYTCSTSVTLTCLFVPAFFLSASPRHLDMSLHFILTYVPRRRLPEFRSSSRRCPSKLLTPTYKVTCRGGQVPATIDQLILHSAEYQVSSAN